MRQLQTVLLLLVSVYILSGCAEKERFIVYGSTQSEEELETSLKQEDYIEKATVIQNDNKMLVAVQIKPWDKWKKQKLEKKLQKKYEKLYPEKEVFVSTDFKIFYEANKIKKEKLEGEKISEIIDQLKKLAKEQT